MSNELPSFNEHKQKRSANIYGNIYPHLSQKPGHPFSMGELVVALNLRSEGDSDYITNTDKYDVRRFVSRSRKYLSEEESIYGVFQEESYVLTNKADIDSWIPVGFRPKSEMSVLSKSDLDMIHQCNVKSKDKIVRRLSEVEYDVFWYLCRRHLEVPNLLVPTDHIAKDILGFNDSHMRYNIRVIISRIRSKISCLESVGIESARQLGLSSGGYRIATSS